METVHAMDALLDSGYDKIGEKRTETFRLQPSVLWIERNIYPVYEKEMEVGCSKVQSLYKG